MGGEMIFHHRIEKPINNLTVYEQLVQNIVTDCKNQVVPVEFDVDKPTQVLEEKEKQWEEKSLGVDDDYIIGITLQEEKENYNGSARDSHFYILFPKDPNAFKVISWMHARGFSFNFGKQIKRWIHDYLTEFEKTFPGVFELEYGDGYWGVSMD